MPFPDEVVAVMVETARPEWATEGRRYVTELAGLAGPAATRVDHIGSTAVPGLAAKDCIDLMISVSDLEDQHLLERLTSVGYRLRPEAWNQTETTDGHPYPKLVFAPPVGSRRRNVHVRLAGSPNARYALLFRDFLRADPTARDAWGAFKRRLALIAGATFVLQRIQGLSPAQFSLVFGANSLGIMACGQLAGRLARRQPPHRILGLGLSVNLVGALTVLTAVVLDLGLPALLVGLFVMVAAVGLVFPTTTALAMADHPEHAGAASSLLGLGQYVAGAAVAPLVGIAGERSALPLGLVAAGCSLAASAVFWLVARPGLQRLPVVEH